MPLKSSSRTKRIRLIAGIFAILAAVACLFWWRSNNLRQAPEAPAPNLARAQTAAIAVKQLLDPNVAAQMLSVQKPRSAEPSWQAMLEKVAALLSGEKAEVCGLSDLDAAVFIAINGSQSVNGVNVALAEVAGKFIRSDQPREKALGLYLQAHVAELAASEAEGSNYRLCKDGTPCRASESTESSTRVKALASVPLIQLALATRDPNVYATAFYACRGVRTGNCASISAVEWAKIEPDNAAVWVLVANDAAQRKDVEARDDALRHAGAANGYDARIPSFASMFEADSVTGQPPLVQSLIGSTFIGMNGGAAVTQAAALGSICVTGEAMDAMRKSLCDKLASKMLETDNSVLGLIVPTVIGERIGWDAARIQALRDERTVATGRMIDMTYGKNAFGCDTLARTNKWIKLALAKGERVIAREHVVAIGKPLSEIAENYRKAYPDLIR